MTSAPVESLERARAETEPDSGNWRFAENHNNGPSGVSNMVEYLVGAVAAVIFLSCTVGLAAVISAEYLEHRSRLLKARAAYAFKPASREIWNRSG